MDKKKLFPLAAAGGETRVALSIRAQGEKYLLVHIFRELTAADKKLYWAALSRAELASGGGSETGIDYLGANEKLYDDSILRVEGYDFSAPGAPGGASWKEAVPLEHKLWAVEELLACAGTISRETAKN